MITAAKLAEGLRALGLSDDQIESCRRATARERHAERRHYAMICAQQYAREKYCGEMAEIDLLAWLICHADCIGIGGPGGIGGRSGHCATDRHPAFSGCGKGRKQATDGQAWSAAIADAKCQFSVDGGARRLVIRPVEPLDAEGSTDRPALDIEGHNLADAIRAVLPDAWYRAVLCRTAIEAVEREASRPEPIPALD